MTESTEHTVDADQILEQLRAITDAAPTSIVYIDRDERYTFVNRYYVERYGRSDSIGKTIRDVIGDPDYQKLKDKIQLALSGKTVSFETEIERPGRSPIFVAATYSPSFNSLGEVQGFVSVSEDITEKRTVELALKKSQQSLELALQSAQMGTWEFNVETQFSNPPIETLRIFGIRPEDWDHTITMVMSRVHPDDQPRVGAEIGRCITSGSVLESEHRIVHEEGQIRWVAMRGRCVREDISGKPTLFSGVVYDITERKEREAKNAFLLKAVSAFSKTLRPSEVLSTAVDLCTETFGSDAGTLLVPNAEKTQLLFIPSEPGVPPASSVLESRGIPIDSPLAGAHIFRSGKPVFVSSREERNLLYPDAKDADSEKYMEAFAGLPLIFEGTTIGVLAIIFKNKRTISQADKRAFIAMGDLVSQALERSKLYEQTQIERDQYRAFFDLSGSGAAEIDMSSDKFIRVNQRFSEITGYSIHELREMTLVDLNLPEDRERVGEEYKKLKKGPASNWRVEKKYKRKDGSICWVICSGAILRDSHGKPVRNLVTFFDITNLKDAEKALLKAVKSRDDFLSLASHELKTPLTSLQLQIQLRQRDLKRNIHEPFSPERLETWLNGQNKYVNRISRLVDDILDVSRIAEGKLHFQYEAFELCEMVTDVLKRFKITADMYGVELKFESCDPVHGKWDRFRLEQVLLNLLSNALRYGNKKPIHVTVSSDDTHAILKVKDEGIGINEDDKLRIFNRFERAISENEVSGLGLGLFISSEIIAAHQGTIEVRSALGKGAEFVVTIPRDSPVMELHHV